MPFTVLSISISNTQSWLGKGEHAQAALLPFDVQYLLFLMIHDMLSGSHHGVSEETATGMTT
jgi:hypothetical protein